MTRAFGLIWTLQRPEVALTLLDEERSTSGTDPLLSGLLDAAESGAHLMRGDVVSAVRAGTRALATPDIGDLATVVAAIGTTVGLVCQGLTGQATEVADGAEEAAIRLRDSAPPMVAGLWAARWEALDCAGHLTALKVEAEMALTGRWMPAMTSWSPGPTSHWPEYPSSLAFPDTLPVICARPWWLPTASIATSRPGCWPTWPKLWRWPATVTRLAGP